MVLFTALFFLRLQRYFNYVHLLERRTRKLWNLGNYFLSSQNHLPVVILTVGILFEVIVLFRKWLEKKIKKLGGQAVASLQFFRSGVIFKEHFTVRKIQREFMSWFESNSDSCLKVHQCRYENLTIYSSSYKNSILQISHYNTFSFMKYAHLRYVKFLFTNIQKQQNALKSSHLVTLSSNR